MTIFAVPGDADFTICEERLRPENTVRMNGVNPNTEIYVASKDGTWVVKDYASARKAEILKAWPIDKQLEAITEYANNRPEKMNQLKEFIQTVKELYPKPSTDE